MFAGPLAFSAATLATACHAAEPGLQRSCGRAAVRFVRNGAGQTVLADLHQSAPCRALLPQSEDLPTAVFAATCGGLTGGDAVAFDFAVGTGAAAIATTQAAERIYRARPGDAPARIDSHVTVGGGAHAEWLPQETILFDGARLSRRTRFDLAADACLLACELRVLGRAAHGEVFRSGFLSDRIELRRGGQLEWLEVLRLEGDIARTLASPAGFGGHPCVATAFYAAPDAPAHRDAARAILAGETQARAAVSAWEQVLAARFLASDAFTLRRAVARFVAGFRAHLGRAPVMPRFWSL